MFEDLYNLTLESKQPERKTEMDSEEATRKGVRMAAAKLSSDELVAQNLRMQLENDPRNVAGYEKIAGLYTLVKDGIPIAHAVVKDEFARIVLERTM